MLLTASLVVLQQYILHKGTEADSFFVILRGEVQECVKLMLNESSEMRCSA